MASAPSSQQQRTLWMWKANVDPWNKNQSNEWKRYSDIENRVIEDAYHRKVPRIELDGYWIDFKHKVQVNKQDTNKQRPIRRVAATLDEYIREERFVIEQPKLSAKSFSTNYGRFLTAAGIANEPVSDELVEKAASGIEEVGTDVGKKIEAQWMANELRETKGKGEDKIGKCCVRLYTIESFLYKLLNKVLRETEIGGEHWTKSHFVSTEGTKYGRTLGPYCRLLAAYLEKAPRRSGMTIFRGADLTNEMVEDYRKHVGKWINWNSFSSTTKNKQKALSFHGNTLFQIQVPEDSPWWMECVDISSLSEYPQEEEILLDCGLGLEINSVEYDPEIKRHIIDLKMGSWAY